MIIITDTEQLTTKNGVKPSINSLKANDYMGPGSRLDGRTVSYADLLVITDTDTQTCYVAKDRFWLFHRKLYSLLMLGKIIKTHNLVWLYGKDPNELAWVIKK